MTKFATAVGCLYRSLQFGIGQMFYWIVATLGIGSSPILLYMTWRKQLSVLQQVKDTKGGPAVMRACFAWMPLANLYMGVKFIVSISHSASPSQYQRDDDVFIAIGVVYLTVASSIAAVIQGRKSLPLLPNANVLRSAITRRGVKFHVWFHFNAFVLLMTAKAPFAVLLVGTNPFLYGSALLAIVFAASLLLLLLTATLFTIGQVFLEDPDFRLTWREAVRQAGWLLLVGTGCVAVALFLGCICFLLLLSKDGNKVQSVSGVASFLMRHVVLTALPLLMNSLIRFIRNIKIYT